VSFVESLKLLSVDGRKEIKIDDQFEDHCSSNQNMPIMEDWLKSKVRGV
jgi:hypothetical protein